MEYQWNKGRKNCVNKKKSIAKLDHSDLLSVYKSDSALMPISRENMNVLVRFLELNIFKFRQMDHPRWPQRVVTKN